jgi:hypothetical protein
MGTHGLYGFYYNGKLYLIYNRWDSYPSGLGSTLVNEIKEALKDGTFENWKNLLIKAVIILEDEEDQENDGSFLKILNSGRIQLSEEHVEKEYVYILDLDNNSFYFYDVKINFKITKPTKEWDILTFLKENPF